METISEQNLLATVPYFEYTCLALEGGIDAWSTEYIRNTCRVIRLVLDEASRCLNKELEVIILYFYLPQH